MEAKKDDFSASLRAALAEHPDYPVIVLVSDNAVPDVPWCVCTDNARVEVGEYLDCPPEQSPREEWVYMSTDELYDDLYDDEWASHDSASQEELDKKTQARMAEFAPYWRACIIIRVY